MKSLQKILLLLFFCFFYFFIFRKIKRSEIEEVKDVEKLENKFEEIHLTENEFMKLIKDQNMGVTEKNFIQNKNIKIIQKKFPKNEYLTIEEFKKIKSKNFIEKYSNPVEKKFPNYRPKLISFPVS